MTAIVLPHSQELRLRPRRVTRRAADAALRVVCRNFEPSQIADLSTKYSVHAGRRDDEDGQVGASAPTLDGLLTSDTLTEAVIPHGTIVELTNLTITAQNTERTVRIVIAAEGVDIDITGADRDWVCGRARDFRAIFTPGHRPWAPTSSFERRDFALFGIGLDILGAAVLFAAAPQELLTSTAGRIAVATAAFLIPVACWLIAARIVRRSRVRITATEPVGWWQSIDTMTKLTLGLFAAAVLTLLLGIAQNGLNGTGHGSLPPVRTAPQEDGIQ
ncbi:hypothetical protein [Streptomyces sp. NPDC006285]|uniref:hypothetical protein n=1 Tax=Streptomyces sp. NPDC006285 TaxID=3364742 RepID=UPI003691F554